MPPAAGDFDTIVLAGGRATRLGGADKPGLRVGGRSLLAAVVAAGHDAGAGRTIVVGPDRAGPAQPDPERSDPERPVRFVREEPPGAGPVAALRRGLAELPGDGDGDGDGRGQVAVLAADLPFLRAAHLRTLMAAAGSRNGAVLIDDEGYPQWLAGCWRRRPLLAAAAAYTGFSLRGLMAPLGPALVLIEPGPGEPPPWLDCDTDADLRRARDWTAASGGH